MRHTTVPQQKAETARSVCRMNPYSFVQVLKRANIKFLPFWSNFRGTVLLNNTNVCITVHGLYLHEYTTPEKTRGDGGGGREREGKEGNRTPSRSVSAVPQFASYVLVPNNFRLEGM